MNLLEIRSSLFSEERVSSRLAAAYVRRWQQAHPDGQVTVRDLARSPIAHLTAERFNAFLTAPEQLRPVQAAVRAESDALIAELNAAGRLVIGLPMYNFGMPSTLKAYFDHIARAGVSFRYGPNGVEGLIKNRKTLIFATRGGLYQGTPADTETPYITMFLNFLGIRDIEYVYAEGLNLGDAAKADSVRIALDAVAELPA